MTIRIRFYHVKKRSKSPIKKWFSRREKLLSHNQPWRLAAQVRYGGPTSVRDLSLHPCCHLHVQDDSLSSGYQLSFLSSSQQEGGSVEDKPPFRATS